MNRNRLLFEMEQEKKWYCLRVISNKERKIKERLDLEIARSVWQESISQTIVPTEKIYKIKNGKKTVSERNLLPGYILVEAVASKLNADVIQMIQSVKDVMHFLGHQNPIPMRPNEVNRLLGKIDESQEIGETLAEPFIVGELVKITDGSFSGFEGTIQEINEERKRLKVIVKIFGRGTEVELNFMQVEKQS